MIHGTRLLAALFLCTTLLGCASPSLVSPGRGTGDLGLVIERESGSVAVINTSAREVLGRIAGLGDLSHASLVYSRDGAKAYVFGRDGALTKVNLISGQIEGRPALPHADAHVAVSLALGHLS